MPHIARSSRLRAAASIFIVAIVLLLTTDSSRTAGRAPAVPLAGAPAQFVLKFNPSVTDSAIRDLATSTGATDVRTVAGGLHVFVLAAGANDVAALARYQRDSNVAYAERDALITPALTPDDPGLAREWHLNAIEAPAAWDLASATGVLIAICDTGVAATQLDLVPVLRADLGHNSADGSANWAPVTNHGTLVAGVAAAVVNNGIGVAGVAQGASLLPIRITNRPDGGASVSDAAACVTYAADHGARVINLSFEMAGSTVVDDAARYAMSKGALTFVGAGNSGTNPGWPEFGHLIAVSATEPGGTHAAYSNYGAFIGIAAPGTGIMTTWPDGHYDVASGTSFASPVAAGVAALIFGANPSLTADQARAILFQSADDLGAAGNDVYFGAGQVNARRAVEAAIAARGNQVATPADPPLGAGQILSPGPSSRSHRAFVAVISH